MSLSEKEKKELEMLDNPDIKSFSSSFGPLWSSLNITRLGTKKKNALMKDLS